MSDSISQGIYVYTLAYPESMGGAIFYVGKGRKNRINNHDHEARKGMQSTKCDVIRKIWATGEKVIKEKVAHFDNEYDAHLYEWGLMNMTTYAEGLTNKNRGINLHYQNNTKYSKTEDEISCNLLEECVDNSSNSDLEAKRYTFDEICIIFQISPRTLYRWCNHEGITPHTGQDDARRKYLTNNQFVYLSKKYNRICLTETETMLLKEIDKLQARVTKLERKLNKA